MAMSSFRPLPLTILTLALAIGLAATEEPEAPLSTIPYQQSLLVGSNATVECHFSKELAANHSLTELAWFHPNGTRVADEQLGGWTSIVAVNGTLKAFNLEEGDSGEYVCSLMPARAFNASATLQIYSMPSYMPQLTFVYAVDAALLLVFLALGVQSLLMANRSSRLGGFKSGGGSSAVGGKKPSSSQQQQPPHQLHRSRISSRSGGNRSESDAAATAAAAVADSSRDGGGESGGELVRSHRHHSTVPKPASAEG